MCSSSTRHFWYCLVLCTSWGWTSEYSVSEKIASKLFQKNVVFVMVQRIRTCRVIALFVTGSPTSWYDSFSMMPTTDSRNGHKAEPLTRPEQMCHGSRWLHPVRSMLPFHREPVLDQHAGNSGTYSKSDRDKMLGMWKEVILYCLSYVEEKNVHQTCHNLINSRLCMVSNDKKNQLWSTNGPVIH